MSEPVDRGALRTEILLATSRYVLDWTDANHSDPGLALLELFAWVADQLSVLQDHAVDEAVLGTRRRLAGLAHHLRSDAGTVVTVDGALWHPAEDAPAHCSDGGTYLLETAADGSITIRFGDGRSGALPPGGTEVSTTWRWTGGAVTLAIRWPPEFHALAARIAPDGLTLRVAGEADAAG